MQAPAPRQNRLGEDLVLAKILIPKLRGFPNPAAIGIGKPVTEQRFGAALRDVGVAELDAAHRVERPAKMQPEHPGLVPIPRLPVELATDVPARKLGDVDRRRETPRHRREIILGVIVVVVKVHDDVAERPQVEPVALGADRHPLRHMPIAHPVVGQGAEIGRRLGAVAEDQPLEIALRLLRHPAILQPQHALAPIGSG